MEEKGNPRERLIKSAVDLIYNLGFDSTTINHLIEASRTHKASFYRHFQNKEEIGELYLQLQGQQFANNWKALMSKSQSREQFVSVWVSLLKRQIRKNAYHGCPVARFMASSEKSSASTEIARGVLEEWIRTLGDFFFSFEPLNQREEKARERKIVWLKKAKQFIKIFQGNSQLYIITNELSYIDEMEKEFLDLLKAD